MRHYCLGHCWGDSPNRQSGPGKTGRKTAHQGVLCHIQRFRKITDTWRGWWQNTVVGQLSWEPVLPTPDLGRDLNR